MNLFMSFSVKEALASLNSGLKNPLEDVGRGQGNYEILAHYSEV